MTTLGVPPFFGRGAVFSSKSVGEERIEGRRLAGIPWKLLSSPILSQALVQAPRWSNRGFGFWVLRHMATSLPPKRWPFETRFGLQWQVRLLLVAALGVTLLITFLAQRSQSTLSACVGHAIDTSARQGAMANEIALEILKCRNCESRVRMVWDLPKLRQKEMEAWKAAHERLTHLLTRLQATPLEELENREVMVWSRAVRHHGEGFAKLVEGLEAGRFVSHDALMKSLDRKEEHLCALLEVVEEFAGRKMAAIQVDGKKIRDMVAVNQWGIAFRAVLTIVVVGGIGWWFSRRVIHRIQQLTVTVARFGNGELQVRAPGVVRDELGILSYQFNEMAGEIQVSLDRLNQEIAKHKQTAAELRKAQEAAQGASLAKDEFLANVSHEIRTPMTAILGFTEVLLGNVTHPDAVSAAKTIQRNGASLLEIIDDILDLSKIEAGRLELEQTACSPQQILTDVIELMQVRADAKGLCLEVACEGALPATIRTDPTRLRQILVNLIGNAIKFTETGRVRVVVRFVDEETGQRKLRFDVIDTGIGISADRLARLFTPFMQGDSSMHRQYGGSGLGLAISKRLAEMLGGTITVSSQPGQGSTFSATLTAGTLDSSRLCTESDDELRGARGETIPQQPIQLNCRILLAEDGPDNQRLISFLLKKAGAEVTLAENGQIALERALSVLSQGHRRYNDRTDQYALIIMDMQMPVMDGYEATRRLRDEGYQGPIVALTAHAMAEDRQRCIDAGCDDYVTKPVDRERLLAVLASVLARTEDRGCDEEYPGYCRELANGSDS